MCVCVCVCVYVYKQYSPISPKKMDKTTGIIKSSPGLVWLVLYIIYIIIKRQCDIQEIQFTHYINISHANTLQKHIHIFI